MNSHAAAGSLSTKELERIDALCEQFELQWRAQGEAQIEPLLGQVPEQLRGPLFCALVLVDFEWRHRRGTQLDIAAYRSRFPAWAQWLEGIAVRCDISTNGRPNSALQPTLEKGSAPKPPAPLPVALNSVVGKYQIISVLGQGTFGTVYRARHLELAREVALKVCAIHGSNPEALAQFRREGQTLARLVHPHIVGVYDAWVEEGNYFVASELIAGPSLRQAIEQGPRWTPQAAARLVMQIAKALAQAHQESLVHRDVKPANILLRSDGEAVLADFGLALPREEFSLQKDLSGTPQYMSPEQARGDGNALDGRSDLYSLGVILYEMLTGKRPHTGRSIVELLQAIESVDPVPPRQLVPSIPAELESICLRCLAKRPGDRFQSGADLAAALHGFLSPPTVEPATNAGSKWGPLIAGVLALATVLILTIWRPWESPVPGPTIPASQTTLAQVDRAELYVQRGEAAGSPIDRLLLVENGVDSRSTETLTPLDRDDRFVLLYRFAQPTPWILVHVDPAGGAAVVASSEQPQTEVRVPDKTGRGVAFASSDPRGPNLLILLAGNLPAEMTDATLAERVGQVRNSVESTPVWSQLRAGFEEKSAAVQLPQDYLREVESRLPSGLTPRHALLLRTND